MANKLRSEDLQRAFYAQLGAPRRGEMQALPENVGLLGMLADKIQDPMHPERGLLMGGMGDYLRDIDQDRKTGYGGLLSASLDTIPGVDDLMAKGLLGIGAIGAVKVGGKKAASILPMDDASRMLRAAEMGHERGFYRGGKSAADGPWYARSEDAAREYGQTKTPNPDVREYSLKTDNAFSYGKTYTAEDLVGVKKALEERGYDQTAKYLLDVPGDYGGAAPGEAIVQMVKHATGPLALGPVFKSAGFDLIDMGKELVVTHMDGTVRDAAKAAYDKAKKKSPEILAGLLAPAVGLSTYTSLGLNDDSL